MNALLSLSSAFGLSGAAGLNAYIPLLTLSIMANRGIITLAPPFDVMGQWWCIILLAVLLIIEIIVDKVPGADHVNDIVQSIIRPAAGAIVFAAQAGAITGVHPAVWITIGLLISGGVHVTKALARPVVNVSSAGIGAPVVSLVEDLISTTLSIVAILAPILCAFLLVIFGWLLYKLFRKLFQQRRRRAPVPVPAIAMAEESAAPSANWGGGV